jgi:hypothetical protein
MVLLPRYALGIKNKHLSWHEQYEFIYNIVVV